MFSIRTATKDDADILTEIEAKSFPPAEAAGRDRFVERLAHFGDDFLILERDGKPVGLVDGMVTDQPTITDDMYADASLHNPNGRYQSVFGLAVIPEERHQGFATQLLHAFIDKARQEGRIGVILCCKKHMIPFYSSFGFVEQGVSKSEHGGAVWYDMTLLFADEKRAEGQE